MNGIGMNLFPVHLVTQNWKKFDKARQGWLYLLMKTGVNCLNVKLSMSRN